MQANRVLIFLFILSVTRAGAQTSALGIADSLYAIGNYSQVIEVLQEVAPREGAVYVRLAKAHEARRQFAEAKDYYRKALEENPDRIVTAVDYAKLLSGTGALNAADSIFSVLAKAYPETASFRYELGLVRKKKKDSTAIDLFYMSIALDPGHQQALYKVSRNALAKRKFHIAEMYSRQGLETNPSNLSLISILGQALYHRKQYEMAVPQFLKLVEAGQGSEFVHRSLGMCYFKLGAYEQAIEYYRKALEFEDRNPSTHLSLGQLYYRIGDYGKSELHLLMAIMMKKQLLDSEYLSLALTYKEMENFETAIKYTKRALEENPDNERALFEKAIIADHFYKDRETKLKFYEAYLGKFESTGSRSMVLLAKQRVKDLKAELHFGG